jgi:hypothetical protein
LSPLRNALSSLDEVVIPRRLDQPKPKTSNSKAAGLFGKQYFVYIAADDVYICPARERLTRRAGKMIRRYWTQRNDNG